MNIISKFLNAKYLLALSVQFLLFTSALIAQTTTFNYTGTFQTYIVPPGITSVRIESWGAAGGDASSLAGIAEGGKGGYVAGDLAVTPGQTLYIYVGGKGQDGFPQSGDLAGGFNGGGIGAGFCPDFALSAGGGASDVRVGGQMLANRVLVAGGGGGGSSIGILFDPNFGLYNGGFGGFPNGGNGTPNPSWTGLGGTQTSGQCVGGATPPVNGPGYDYCGQLGEGGFSTGSYCNSGGGGGLYGGSAGSGAGGGSSFLGNLLNTEFRNGVRSSDGQVIVTAGNLLCQNHINASINASCDILLTSGTFLTGGAPVGLAVVIKNGSSIIAGPSSSILLNASALNLIGKTYSYEVLSGNNKCWGTVKFEDKTAPELICPINQDVACNANIGYSATEKEIISSGSANANQITAAAYGAFGLLAPAIRECSAYKLYYSDTKTLNCSGAYVGSVLRTFRVTDAYGNTVSCTQQINLLAPSTVISTPSNITINVCANAIDLSNYEPAILASSVNNAISANAYPAGLHPNNLGDCMLSASKTDKITDNACGKKIVRTWVVVNMCTGTIVNLAGAAAQIITLTDNEAPVITVPSNTTVNVGTATGSCLSGQSVKFPVTTDNCKVEFRTLTIGGATFTASANGTVSVFGLPLGNYVGTWRAVDACGNTAIENQAFTVSDNVAPIAVADQNTNVSMTLDCSATINAASFDDGSIDNCCLDVNRFEIARMNADGSTGTFAPSITFTKADLNGDCTQTLQIVFRVWDCNGNSNTAMVNVKLEDKIGPSAAGKDTTAMCGNDAIAVQWLTSWEARFRSVGILDYPPVFGTNPGYFDNCSSAVSWGAISGTIDQCGNGFRTRTATVTDKCGKSTTATFKYTSGQQALFAVTLPPNEKANCPGTGVTTKADAIAKARASLKVYDGCPVVAIDIKREEVFASASGACYRIKRTWVVSSLCHSKMSKGATGSDDNPVMGSNVEYVYISKYDGSDSQGKTADDDKYVEYIQTIDVTDNEKPTISGAKAPTFAGVGKCGVKMTVDGFTATDACVTDPANIKKTWELLDANKQALTPTIPAAAAQSSFPGTYEFPKSDWGKTFYVRLKAEDRCGNADVRDYAVVPSDVVKPTAVCFQGLSTDLMATTGDVWLSASMFDAGSSDGCAADARNATIKPAVSNPTPALNTRQFSSDNSVELRIEAAPFAPVVLNTTGQAIAPATNMIWVGCVGVQPIRLWAIDADGNADYCDTYVDVQNNFNATPKVSTPCSGNAANTRTIAGAITTSNGKAIENTTVTVQSSTAANGKMTAKVQAGNYSIVVGAGTNVKVAADKNDNPLNGVSVFDLVLISKHILGTQVISEKFTQVAADVNNNGKISTSDVVELRKMILGLQANFNNNKSWRFYDANMNEEVVINDIQSNTKVDFTAIKTGDINGNANAASSQRTTGTHEFNVADKTMVAGETVTIALSGTEGFGFTMNYDAKSLEVVSVDENSAVIENGTITTAQVGSEFKVTFKATANVTLSNAISIDSKITAAEAVVYGQLNNVALKFNNKTAGFELFQNQPNPFRETTMISFVTPVESEYTLTVTDLTGRIVASTSGIAVKGLNNVNIEINNAGVYQYTVTAGKFTATKKMVVND